MARLCIVLTVPFTLNAFVRPHLDYLLRMFEITVCVNMRNGKIPSFVPQEVRLKQLDIERRISPWADLIAAYQLQHILRAGQFDIVLSMTPKGGMIGMGCALLCGVSTRIHCFTGQVWATRTGFVRVLLRAIDRAIAFCATRLLADSQSQRDFLIENGVVRAEKIRVLANGSMAGVDVDRFRPDPIVRSKVRTELGLEDESVCILYVGRLNGEKGVPELVAAFAGLAASHQQLHLLLVGPEEEPVPSVPKYESRIHRVGYTTEVERYMAGADIFCLPSHREGFGQVLIEAGAVGLPVVASRIYGITDAVVDGVTGLLHEPREVGALVQSLAVLIQNPPLRARLGEAGRQRAQEEFGTERVSLALSEFLQRELERKSKGTA